MYFNLQMLHSLEFVRTRNHCNDSLTIPFFRSFVSLQQQNHIRTEKSNFPSPQPFIVLRYSQSPPLISLLCHFSLDYHFVYTPLSKTVSTLSPHTVFEIDSRLTRLRLSGRFTAINVARSFDPALDVT